MAIRHLITVIDRDLDAVCFVLYGDDFNLPEVLCRRYATEHRKGGFEAKLDMDIGLGEPDVLRVGRKTFRDDQAMLDWERIYADSSWTVTISERQSGELHTKIESKDGCGELVFMIQFARDLAWLERNAA